MKIEMNIRFYYALGVIFASALSQELSENFQSNTASEKQDEWWEILSSAEPGKQSPFTLLSFPLVYLENHTTTFDHFEDTLPYDHTKRIHPVGGVCKATWKSVGNHTYTGLFDGETHALVRLGPAMYPIFYIPGIGVKLFRDGMPSANFVAMYSIEGQGSDGNFFALNFSNHIVEPSSLPSILLGEHFGKFARAPGKVGLSDIASHDQNGNEVDNAAFPYKLLLVPNAELHEKFQGYSNCQTKEILTSITSGTKLWDILAISEPDDTDWVKIAELTATSDVIFSRTGDEYLFFRHQKMSDDYAIHPEWEEVVDDEERRLSACPGLRNMLS